MEAVEVAPAQRITIIEKLLVALLLFLAAGAGVAAYDWARVKPISFSRQVLLPQPSIQAGQVFMSVPGYTLVADGAAYGDELFAYLMFDYLRSRSTFDGVRLLLTFDPRDAETPYRMRVVAGGNLTAGIARMEQLEAAGSIRSQSWHLAPESERLGFESQTQLFVSAYNLPVRRKLEQLPRNALSNYLRRFIRFKSNVDPRIRRKLELAPKALSPDEAQHLAGDILTVAEFYSLPLEFFLAIGAMENNYMNVRGDLTHSIWKRRPAPDDIVLERRRGRVRVLNDSAGVWQITRETLRLAHRLYLRDTRDYSQLPEHLRPPQRFAMNEVTPQILTTYAGLLLRDLLDRFDGDVTLAVSAYNGGPGRPNLKYGEGAHAAAAHARRVLEQAAALNGESVMRTSWVRPR